MGSPYVPLDSWIYPAFERLIALGYVRSAILGQQPWTRLECARLLTEANEQLQSENGGGDEEALSLYDSLVLEFTNERALMDGEANRSLRLESIYARVLGISGTPLTDDYHFGQTVLNDYGRPFGEGFNSVDGFSGWASEGPLTGYFRGEYQHAPPIPAPSSQALQFIANSFGSLPVPPAIPTPAVNRFQVLDAYVALNLENWQLAFGKQSLWWGPSHDGPLMFSDNALPITMFRIDRVTPFRLPWILRLFGPIKGEFFLGRLSGHKFAYGVNTGLVGQWSKSLSDQPFIDGAKLNFKPTPDFEFGVGLTTMIGGPGVPFTFHKFVQSLTALRTCEPGSSCDPGDRRSSVDFSYRAPGLRKWLTFYGDAFTQDEYSPLGYPRKAVFQGGIYMPKLPGVRKLDLNVEGGSTSPPDWRPGTCNACFYASNRFLNGWTNAGNLVGGWIGRSSQGEEVSSTYWLTPQNTIQVNYRHRKLDTQFIPNGGTVNDGAIRADYWLGQAVRLSGSVQYEKWQIPVLDSSARSNISASFEVGFWPLDWRLHAH
ncbi:MAG: capsule assembly Wzi family protein [Candidatus Sulfotelmatobacter sp.]